MPQLLSESYVPWRYTVVGITCLAVMSLTCMRYCFTLTLTQIVVPPEDTPITFIDAHACPFDNNVNASLVLVVSQSNDSVEVDSTIASNNERYAWSQELQGIVHASFFLGSTIAHIPGGWLSDRFGGKRVITAALVSCTLLTVTTPAVIAYGDAYGLIASRFVQGLMHGGIFPAVNTILSAWVPPHELGRMASIVICGYSVGSTIGSFFSGVIMHYHSGWEFVFYYFSIFGVITIVLFVILCSSKPGTHSFVSEAEKSYLRKELVNLNVGHDFPSTPWKAILTSRSVVALLIGSFLADWTYYVVETDLPKYMNDVLHVSVEENGIYSSIPWAVFVPVALLSSYWCDWLISSGRLNITQTRKLFVFISSVVDGCFVIAAAYSGCNALLVGIFFAISVGATGLQTSSLWINAIDLSPNYSGTLCGFSSTFSSLAGTLGPMLVGFLTPNSQQSEWRIVFWINFSMHICKVLLFTAWGSADVQPWNEPTEKKTNKHADDDERIEINSVKI